MGKGGEGVRAIPAETQAVAQGRSPTAGCWTAGWRWRLAGVWVRVRADRGSMGQARACDASAG
eukprot:360318-Chlamydomonas_euryale.AAC.4